MMFGEVICYCLVMENVFVLKEEVFIIIMDDYWASLCF